MSLAVTPITLHYLFDVNCYLVATSGGYVLVDTGTAPRREKLDRQLSSAGCEPGSLRLIVLTHAHTDHAGNCAYLRKTYGAPIAMHAGDVGKVERGDMFWRADGSGAVAATIAKTMLFLVGLGRFDCFEPDVLLSDGQSLCDFGFDAKVVHLPGHTPGSIGVLSHAGDLFCGDLLTNAKRPQRNSMAEDASALRASVERLRSLEIKTVYPGHGEPFPGESLVVDDGRGRMRREG
jgi:hydroxyacylglutathione hydrolase